MAVNVCTKESRQYVTCSVGCIKQRQPCVLDDWNWGPSLWSKAQTEWKPCAAHNAATQPHLGVWLRWSAHMVLWGTLTRTLPAVLTNVCHTEPSQNTELNPFPRRSRLKQHCDTLLLSSQCNRAVVTVNLRTFTTEHKQTEPDVFHHLARKNTFLLTEEPCCSSFTYLF